MFVVKRKLLSNLLKENAVNLALNPYPPSEGLWSKPTIVNNVETFANIPS